MVLTLKNHLLRDLPPPLIAVKAKHLIILTLFNYFIEIYTRTDLKISFVGSTCIIGIPEQIRQINAFIGAVSVEPEAKGFYNARNTLKISIVMNLFK